MNVTCVNSGTYKTALTRGKRYEVLQMDEDECQVRIRGDNQRIRWFPVYCFDLTGGEVPTITQLLIEDFDEPTAQSVEVTVEFSDGQRRWCFCVTPQILSTTGDYLEDTHIRLHYACPHMIVIAVESLTKQIIEDAIRYIDSQNDLINSTLAIGEETD
jgi:hypothetical protein